MCCFRDEEFAVEEETEWSMNHRCIWGFIYIAMVISCTAIFLAGFTIHENHRQDETISNELAFATHSEIVIAATVMEQYYGISQDPVSGGFYKDHIPASFIMPKTGVLYEKAHCVIERDSPMSTIFMMKQFEADFRPLSSHYIDIQLNFEVPFGSVMSLDTGNGYVGLPYDLEHSPLGEGSSFENNGLGSVDAYDPNLVVERKRCGVPYCPDYGTTFGYGDGSGGTGNGDNSAYSRLIGEHYVLYGGLYERISHGNSTTRDDVTNSTSNYVDIPVPIRIRCGCSTETPPRFTCSFPGNALQGKHGWFRLDIGFKYLLKPITKSPYYP